MRAYNTSGYTNNPQNLFVWKVISPGYSHQSLYLSADCNQPMKASVVSALYCLPILHFLRLLVPQSYANCVTKNSTSEN